MFTLKYKCGLLCSVDYIFLSFGITDAIVNFETIRGSLRRVDLPKRASLVQKTGTLYIFSSLVYDLIPNDNTF